MWCSWLHKSEKGLLSKFLPIKLPLHTWSFSGGKLCITYIKKLNITSPVPPTMKTGHINDKSDFFFSIFIHKCENCVSLFCYWKLCLLRAFTALQDCATLVVLSTQIKTWGVIFVNMLDYVNYALESCGCGISICNRQHILEMEMAGSTRVV